MLLILYWPLLQLRIERMNLKAHETRLQNVRWRDSITWLDRGKDHGTVYTMTTFYTHFEFVFIWKPAPHSYEREVLIYCKLKLAYSRVKNHIVCIFLGSRMHDDCKHTHSEPRERLRTCFLHFRIDRGQETRGRKDAMGLPSKLRYQKISFASQHEPQVVHWFHFLTQVLCELCEISMPDIWSCGIKLWKRKVWAPY